MSSSTDTTRAPSAPHGLADRLAAIALPWLVLAAVLLLAAVRLALDPSAYFRDPDDAARLLQVRALLAGAPWHETTIPGLGGAEPLLSHWSRIVDAPLASLTVLLDVVLPTVAAEWLTRVIWPLALLGIAVLVIATAAERRGGRDAALAAIVMSVLCLAATSQFLPGRIDHHNAQILAAVAGVLLLSQAFSQPRLGTPAGAVLGLGMSVGYEALLLVVGGLGAAVLYATIARRGRAAVGDAAVAFAVVLAAAFFLTIPPARWLDVRCDALSLNMVMLAGIAATGLVVTFRRLALGPLAHRLAALVLTGGVALAVYVAAEPACLAGPFGQVDPAIRPIWLDHVSETQSILGLTSNAPVAASIMVLHLVLALGATMALLRTDRDATMHVFAAALLIAAASSLWQLKLAPYAALLGVVPIAIVIGRMPTSGQTRPTLTRLLVALAASQAALGLAAGILLGAPKDEALRFAERVRAASACLSRSAVEPLAGPPPGLAVSDLELGPYIAALTPSRALSAPYHRLDRQILATHAILRTSLDGAARGLAESGIDYVVLCPPMAGGLRNVELPPGSLYAALVAGSVPAFLEPVALPATSPLGVWRVRR